MTDVQTPGAHPPAPVEKAASAPKVAPDAKAEAKAAAEAAKAEKQTITEGVADALANHIHEIDQHIKHVASGDTCTLEHMQQLKTTATGIAEALKPLAQPAPKA